MLIYCVKEKRKTPTKNLRIVRMKNGLYRYAGICSSCGAKKSQIIGKHMVKKQ